MSIKIGNNILAKSSTYHPDLFDVKWSDHIINNISWLRADTFSWHSGELYNRAYEHLLDDYENGVSKTDEIEGITIWYRETQDGHKITTIINGESEYREGAIARLYEKTGIAWYYIIDTENKRFKLPRTKFAFEGVRTAVGNYIEPGLPNATGTLSDQLIWGNGNATGIMKKVSSGSNFGHATGDYDHTGQYELSLSNSNDIYGNSNTVQSPATEMYLYFYVGNYAQSDLENVAGGIQDKDTALNYDNITNCITHIPQDIKLELNDNKTITIKSGTKCYIPNGFESDGTTKKFEEYIYPNDHVCLCPNSVGDYFLLPVIQTNSERHSTKEHTFSGPTQPTVTSQYAVWYDTSVNKIKMTNDTGTTWIERQVALPIAIEHCITANTESSISQVFNGFGYISKTVFVLPGVKGLMPDGRNEDGTLKSKLIVITKVKAVTPTVLHNQDVAIILENNTISYNGTYRYDEDQNKTFDDSLHVLSERQSCYVGSCTLTDSVISNFKINTSFHAVDYNEFNEHRVIDFMRPTADNNYTWYRKYSDGWVEQGGIAQAAGGGWTDVNLPIEMADTKATVNVSVNWATTAQDGLKVPTYYMPSTTRIGILIHGRTGQSGIAYYSGEMSWQVSGMAA